MNKRIEYDVFGCTDTGRARRENQDRIEVFESIWLNHDNLTSWVGIVADGMGGHTGGSLAAELAVKQAKLTLGALDTECNQIFEQVYKNVHRDLGDVCLKSPHNSQMGCTLSIVVTQGEWVYSANVGDSRVYHITSEKITQISQDHSLVQELVRGGMLAKEDAYNHPKGNILTKAMTGAKYDEPDIYEAFKVVSGDTILLCSDGLWNMLPDEYIADIVRSRNVKDAVSKLIDEANAEGGVDNISVVLLRAI